MKKERRKKVKEIKRLLLPLSVITSEHGGSFRMIEDSVNEIIINFNDYMAGGTLTP